MSFQTFRCNNSIHTIYIWTISFTFWPGSLLTTSAIIIFLFFPERAYNKPCVTQAPCDPRRHTEADQKTQTPTQSDKVSLVLSLSVCQLSGFSNKSGQAFLETRYKTTHHFWLFVFWDFCLC